ncbi:Ribosomal RNA small subunit methyltransferase H [Nocardioides aquaticus]|uniref:Ribosomal RNA small subunit methyltransferase H n=1 Tax=Nocardioides aquaticus TaxID=160826 RepID=A0ABX8EJV6_9ACTN|nr:16S rRNA (cytosine(1402)-N(4))-methyltransferase RsmH [Nocardioides aquaticus]QVT80818.1 Ribosomal RNA small subunit methyltransferase H [Nocardioides aquaticus]
MAAPAHAPVLLDRVVALLAPALARPGAVLVDATLGAGGHTEAVLERCPQARVVGVDRDRDALDLARERLAPFGDRFTGVHAVYDEVPDVLAELGLAGADGVLFDLGVSSMQLDRAERGFAYAVDAPLDMRMDASTGPTAADVLNGYDARELTRVLRDYGEEKFARKIAGAVVRQREQAPFTTSQALVELLYREIPAPARRTGGHPAKRTFQALRMEVNDELGVLRRAMPAAVASLVVGGRIVVESYHSLEDRLVKQVLTAATRLDVPDDLPFVPEGQEPPLRMLTRGAEKADDEEHAANPRAASVRLRAAERVHPDRPTTGHPRDARRTPPTHGAPR